MPPKKKVDHARSENMRAIRSSGNATTELRLVALLAKRRLKGWTLRQLGLPGKPDIVMPHNRLAIFVDGCFWHWCPRCGHIPKTNKRYWTAKLERNRRRDRENTRTLRRLGFKVVRIWECQLKKTPEKCLQRIEQALRERHGP